MLHDVHVIPKIVYEAVVSRIKLLSGANLAEKRRPQDGRIKREHGGKEFTAFDVQFIWTTATSTKWAEFMLVIACVAQFFCGAASVTSASRRMGTRSGPERTCSLVNRTTAQPNTQAQYISDMLPSYPSDDVSDVASIPGIRSK